MRELDRNIYQRKLAVKTNSEMEKEIYIYMQNHTTIPRVKTTINISRNKLCKSIAHDECCDYSPSPETVYD
jgi:hypothetical protein